MVYPGSKQKVAANIVPILQKEIDENHISLYIEPFVGGAAIIDKIKCEKRIGNDKNKYLIALLKEVQINPKCLELMPTPSEEIWQEAKKLYRSDQSSDQYPEWMIGAISYFWSFATKGFFGGYCPSSKPQEDLNTSLELKIF